MSLTPKISVIIPTYNRASLVTRAIDSVIAQTFQDFEMILVDDGSTDNTREVLDTYRKHEPERIHVVDLGSNQGKSAALNHAIARARGEWIAFLDSDDLWLPDKLEWQLRALSRFDKCGMCFTDASFFNNPWLTQTVFELAGRAHRGKVGVIERPAVFVAGPYPVTTPVRVQTVVARKALCERVGGFDPKLQFGEDDDFIFWLGLVTGFCYVNLPLVQIDRTPNKVRHTGSAARWDDVEFKHRQRQYRFDKWLRADKEMPPAARRAIRTELAREHSGWANLHLEAGRIDQARAAIASSLRYRWHPKVAAKGLILTCSPAAALWLVRIKAARS